MTRRATHIKEPSPKEVPAMTDGVVGWRQHWRHGLVGAVQYWAHDHRANVVKMLVVLANEFGVANSSEVRGVATLGRGPKAELQEILPAALQGVPVATVGGPSSHTHSAATIQNVSPALGPSTYALRQDVDNSWRERCE